MDKTLKMLAKQLGDAGQSGVYVPTRDTDEIALAAQKAGLNAFRIDMGVARDKKDFLGRIAQALKFPDHFGYNWDALNDFLTDLDWLTNKSGYVLILENLGYYSLKHPDGLKSAIAVLASAAEYWKDDGRPFWAFIHGVDGLDLRLPSLPQS